MGKSRTLIGTFIHNKWTNMNLRAGKYRHLGNKHKNKVYENIKVSMTQPEFKNWCLDNKELILSLNKPSLDRIDSNKDYSLDNIQVISLIENIKKKKFGCAYINGPKENTIRGIRKTKSGKKWSARITVDKKENHIGTYNSKEEALVAFYNKYYDIYGKYPW